MMHWSSRKRYSGTNFYEEKNKKAKKMEIFIWLLFLLLNLFFFYKKSTSVQRRAFLHNLRCLRLPECLDRTRKVPTPSLRSRVAAATAARIWKQRNSHRPRSHHSLQIFIFPYFLLLRFFYLCYGFFGFLDLRTLEHRPERRFAPIRRIRRPPVLQIISDEPRPGAQEWNRDRSRAPESRFAVDEIGDATNGANSRGVCVSASAGGESREGGGGGGRGGAAGTGAHSSAVGT